MFKWTKRTECQLSLTQLTRNVSTKVKLRILLLRVYAMANAFYSCTYNIFTVILNSKLSCAKISDMQKQSSLSYQLLYF